MQPQWPSHGTPYLSPFYSSSQQLIPLWSLPSPYTPWAPAAGLQPSTTQSRTVIASNTPPPPEWRPGFRPPVSWSGLLKRLSKRGSRELLVNRPQKVYLHRHIRYNMLKPPMELDLRRNPKELKIFALEHSLTPLDFTRFACEPPLPRMRLFHARLPWYIDVHAQNPAGVMFLELFMAIWCCMFTPVRDEDFNNSRMNPDAQEQVKRASEERRSTGTSEPHATGICRVDYLMGHVVMEGLKKVGDGMWEIKTRRLLNLPRS